MLSIFPRRWNLVEANGYHVPGMSADTRRAGLEGEGIVCLSSIDWDFIWQQNQEIMSRFAKLGNYVLFVENTGVRSPGFGDLPRLWARLRNWWRGSEGFREQSPNLVVLSPLLLPFPYSRLARRINAALVSRAIERWMRAVKRPSPVLWTFLPTPLVHDVIEAIEPAAVVYYCTAHFAESSPGASPVRDSEERLFKRADVVFVTTKALQERAQRYRPEAVPVRIGIDFEAFEAARNCPAPEPPDMAAIPHPRIGYVGGLHKWVDLAMLAEVARRRPEAHLVLVGPEQTALAELHGHPNVHVIGTRPYRDLPAYIRAFDVGIIPYRDAAYTESVFPTKLNEYLAMGIPAVSTPLPSVLAYNERHGGVAAVAAGPADFLAALDAALENPAQGREQRIAAARDNGWAERMVEMSDRVASVLREVRARPPVLDGVLGRIARPLASAGIRVLGCLLAAWLLFGWTPLLWWMADGLRLQASPRPADVIVVIGGGAGESGVLGRGYGERVVRAVELYRGGYADNLVLCSGERSEFSELDVMRVLALSHGVKPERIFPRSKGGSTYAMLEDADALARAQGWRSALLVSSPYHTARASGVWRRLSPTMEVIPSPAASTRFWRRSGNRGPNGEQLKALVLETAAYAYYLLKGWV